MRTVIGVLVVAGFLIIAGLATLNAEGLKGGAASPERIARGKYLVQLGGCTDCHSPKVMSPNGPVPDPIKAFSGHQESIKVPEIPRGILGPDKWMAMTNSDLTAWAGPWGVSFAANLTPDPATGIGGWTEEMFLNTLKSGKHLGTGRQILPPMPWQAIGALKEEDLKDIYAYFMSLKPVRNAVPQPLPPAQPGH
jgi:mono/diheme cytochrome c family protein